MQVGVVIERGPPPPSIPAIIMALLATAILLLLAGRAHAQACPGSNQSWSFTLQSPQQFAVYDLTNAPPGKPAGLMTVLYYAPLATMAFVAVPQTTAQQWQVASNTNTFYSQRVLPGYRSLLIEQGQPWMNCPVCGPDGVCPWTR